MNRVQTVKKLLSDFHLNVEDRRCFEGEPLTRTELEAGIVALVTDQGRYPISWSSESDFDGTLLEATSSGFRVTEKAEVGLMKYKTLNQRDFASVKEAAAQLVTNMFSDNIDGIEVQ
jgi:hypothetical protein